MAALRVAAALGVCAALALAQVRAGAARRAITPDLSHGPVYLPGSGSDRAATGVHDDLWVRCLALQANLTLVICGVDSAGLFLDDVEKIRDTVNDRLAAPADVVVASVHTQGAPDTSLEGGAGQGYALFVIDRVAEAAVEAVRSARSARLKLGRTQSAELDSFVHDERPPAVRDSELVALSVLDAAGKPIATLVNWAGPSGAVGLESTRITADYHGYFYRELERRLGGVAVLVNGALGGVPTAAADKPAEEDSFRKAERIGRRLGIVAAEAARAATPAPVDRIEFHERPVEAPAPEGDTIHTVAGMFRLSGGGQPWLEAALVPGEPYPELSVGGIARYYGADFPDAAFEPPVKKMMRAPFRMLIGLADDDIGVLIPKAEWDEEPPYLQDAPRPWGGEAGSAGPDAAARVIAALAGLFNTGK